MAIEVELPDGTIVEFPDGTDNATMEAALSSYRASPEPIVDLPAVNALPPRATDNMSGFDRGRAGLGKSIVDTGYGLVQGIAEQPARIVEAGNYIAGKLGVNESGLSRAVTRYATAPARRMREIAAERRAIDKDLMDTGAGMAGNVVGTLAQLVGPGLLARGTSLAPALLPTTVRGNAVQGAAMGLLQPSTDAQDSAQNVALGAGGGLLGSAVPALAGKSVRAARGLLAPFTERGAQDNAARVIIGFAEDPAKPLNLQQSAVPGVIRSLAEATADPGVAQLQRTIAARNGAPFDMQRRSNNAARVAAIRGFAGDELSIEAAEEARSAAAADLLRSALREGDQFAASHAGSTAAERSAAAAARELAESQNARFEMFGLPDRVEVPDIPAIPSASEGLSGIRSFAASLQDKYASNPAVQSAINDVSLALQRADESTESLYEARKYIGALLDGKAGADKSYARAASRELIDIRDRLDQVIAERSPSFTGYLDEYRYGSVPINRMQIGQELLRRGSGGVTDVVTGVETLLPAQFGRQVRGMDRLAQQATGFNKAKAASSLTPSDFGTIRAVNDDLQRQFFADTASRGVGSDTVQKLMTQGDVLGAAQEMGIQIPGIGIINMLGKSGRERVNNQLVAILADPSSAQSVLTRASMSDRKVIQNVLNATGGRLGISSGSSSGN